MAEIGYFLSSEEHGPGELVRQASLASEAGIGSIAISDHFHPWLDDQGESPFVWSVIGAIAATTPVAVMTAVTCPTIRTHPAIIAQAAATSSLLLDGRFELGVGTGEALNEHILGNRWPATDERLEMLEEAVAVMRALWSGEEINHVGPHYAVENARIYSRPDQPPAIVMSAFGPEAADVAARIADGFISTRPAEDLLARYRRNGGRGLASAVMKLCWGPDTDECIRTVHRLWRSSALPGELGQELRTPALYEQAARIVTKETSAQGLPCGPSVEPIVTLVQKYLDAGFDRIYLNQIGPEQTAFFRFFTHELAGALAEIGATADSDASMLDLRTRSTRDGATRMPTRQNG